MIITDTNKLLSNTEYWYVSITDKCNFSEVKVICHNPQNPINKDSFKGNIIFDKKDEAEDFAKRLFSIFEPHIAK